MGVHSAPLREALCGRRAVPAGPGARAREEAEGDEAGAHLLRAGGVGPGEEVRGEARSARVRDDRELVAEGEGAVGDAGVECLLCGHEGDLALLGLGDVGDDLLDGLDEVLARVCRGEEEEEEGRDAVRVPCGHDGVELLGPHALDAPLGEVLGRGEEVPLERLLGGVLEEREAVLGRGEGGVCEGARPPRR